MSNNEQRLCSPARLAGGWYRRTGWRGLPPFIPVRRPHRTRGSHRRDGLPDERACV